MRVQRLRRGHVILTAVVAGCFGFAQLANTASAAQLSNRSMVLSTAKASAIAAHTFQFTVVSGGVVGSIVFEYCYSPVFDYACAAPSGLDVSSAIVQSQTGNVGFAFDNINSTSNKIVLTRAPAAAAAVASSYSFGNITNPSTPSQSEFVRISTYASADGSGPFTDNGAVAFATPAPFSIGASVPPFLRLCVAVTTSLNCSIAAGDRINLGILSASAARDGQSQFSVGTNSSGGYVVYVTGTTLTSGNNAIKALANPTPSFPGNTQFGINLRANTVPPGGSNPAGPGTGAPTASYNIPNFYKFQTGEAIARSTLSSNFNQMTVTYLANVNNSQPPGVYSSTFTYLATANF